MIPAWTERNTWIKQFIPQLASIIDWGCGNKDILRYITPRKYLGIDQTEFADINADFNLGIPKINDHYEVGLVLGVLEYLDDPKEFLELIKPTADTFIILVLSNKRKKEEWTNCFSSDDFTNLILPLWEKVSFERNGNYILAICNN